MRWGFILEKHKRLAKDRGIKVITNKVGEIQKEMGLRDKTPSIHSTPSSNSKEGCGIRLLKREWPPCGAEAAFT